MQVATAIEFLVVSFVQGHAKNLNGMRRVLVFFWCPTSIGRFITTTSGIYHSSRYVCSLGQAGYYFGRAAGIFPVPLEPQNPQLLNPS